MVSNTIQCGFESHPGHSRSRVGAAFHVAAPGRTVVQANWKHWPRLFPQHGSGRKHVSVSQREAVARVDELIGLTS